jgi:hypothetical protein
MTIQMLYIAYSMKYPNTFYSGKLNDAQLTDSIIKFLQKFINYDDKLKRILSLHIDRADMLKQRVINYYIIRSKLVCYISTSAK